MTISQQPTQSFGIRAFLESCGEAFVRLPSNIRCMKKSFYESPVYTSYVDAENTFWREVGEPISAGYKQMPH